jgi:hypothetical protein
MARKKEEQTDAAADAQDENAGPLRIGEADTSAADEAAKSAGIVGAGAEASGFASDNQDEDQPTLAELVEADPQVFGVNPSSTYEGRDKALAATDGGRLMPGNLDAILRAREAGTQVPGDGQLMSEEEIDALKAQFVDGIEPAADDPDFDDPNAIFHGDNEVNPNTPTNERVDR